MRQHGHKAEEVTHYTPRQLAAWLHFAEIDRSHEIADRLVIGLNAARGDPKSVDETVEKLRNE